MLERIKNNYKTIFISSRKEIEEFVSTKIMAIGPNISFSALEDAIKILESMGCGYQTIKLIIYNGISEHGIFLLPENGEFGIELKGDKESNSK